MDTTLSDRNLLFGILAYQNDFISRDEFVAALRRWLLDKSMAVDHILVEQELLDDDQRRLLEALAEVHLARHNGQMADSLAALSSIGSLRDELQFLGVPEIDATLQHVAGKRKNSAVGDTKNVSQNRFVARKLAKAARMS